MRRHPEVSVRKPELVLSAAATVTEENIRKWFKSVRELLVEDGCGDILEDAKRVFNGDEIGFCLDPETKAVLIPKKEKNAYLIDTGSKKSITVMNTYGAAGKAVPPCVILPYQRIPAHVYRSFPANWGVGKSDSGWMTKEAFMYYIENVFHPYLLEENIPLPVILFVDGHKSHTPFETAEACNQLGIILICLYSNSTHIIQPADVAIFRSLKAGWRNQVRIWQAAHPGNIYPNLSVVHTLIVCFLLSNLGKVVRIEEFGNILEKAVTTTFKSQTVVNGFRVCGLFPFDENAVDYTKCIAGKTKPQPSPEKSIPSTSGDTVAVPRIALENIIQQISPAQAAVYRELDLDFFTGESERIVCQLYKTVLQPLDQRKFPERFGELDSNDDDADVSFEPDGRTLMDSVPNAEICSTSSNVGPDNTLGLIDDKPDQLHNDSVSNE